MTREQRRTIAAAALWLLEARLSREEIAKKVGVPGRTLYHWIAGRAPHPKALHRLVRVAKRYGFKVPM
jgi:predicted transcriptional regulator